MSKFPERLSSAIEASGLTKAEVARDLDIHPPALSRWLADTVPSSKHLTKLAKVLNVNAQWLLTGEGPMRDGLSEDPGVYGEGSRDKTRDYCDAQTVAELLDGIHMLLETFTKLPSDKARMNLLEPLQTMLDQMKEAAREGRWK